MKDERNKLGRICHKCEARYVPSGRFQRLCQECIDKSLKERNIKNKYHGRKNSKG